MERTPGEHVTVEGVEEALAARELGWELRDSILVLAPAGARVAFLFRVPLAEATVAAQVLKTGTGALHIEACRVSTTDSYNRAPASSGFSGIDGYARGMGRMSDSANVGRWPTNALLVHGPGCRQEGTRQVRTGMAVRHRGVESGGYGGDLGRLPVGTADLGYGGEDGKGTVAAWACELGCPVATLDGQSGSLHARGNRAETTGGGGMFGHDVIPYEWGAGDAGGASRFFPQFVGDDGVEAWIDRLTGTVG